MKREHAVAALLLILGLAFAFLGQYYFVYQPNLWRDGALFWAVSIFFFILLYQWRRRSRRPERRARQVSRPGWWRAVWSSIRSLRLVTAAGGICLSLLAGILARRSPPTASFLPPLLIWLMGIAAFLSSFVPDLPLDRLWRELYGRLRRRRREALGLALLLLIALLLRAVDLAHIPVNLGGDEGTQGLAALELVEPPLGNPFSTGWYSVPTMSFLAYGLSMRLFGATVTGLRMLSALIGAATVLTTFLFARQLWGRRVAWLAAGMLTFSHYHIHFSRLGSNQIADGFLLSLALWLLMRGLRRGGRWPICFALSGAVVGLGWYGYFGARMMLLIVAAYVGWLWLMQAQRQRGADFLSRNGYHIVVMAVAAFVAIAPLAIYYRDHPGTMMARASQVSIVSGEWLRKERAFTGETSAAILLRQFWKAISAFHYTVDPTYWYHAAIPALDFVSGVLLIFGLVWTAARWRASGSSLLLLWFWMAVILGWALTENPPSSQRMTVVLPAASIIAALGLRWLIALLQRRLGLRGRSNWLGMAVVALMVIAFVNLHYYFFVYTPTGVYGNPTAEIATRLGRYLTDHAEGRVVYFHGAPAMYWDIGNLRFLARGVNGVNVQPPAEGQQLSIAPPQDALFVFLPQRLEELAYVRQRVPGGVERPVYSERDGRLLYVLYE